MKTAIVFLSVIVLLVLSEVSSLVRWHPWLGKPIEHCDPCMNIDCAFHQKCFITTDTTCKSPPCPLKPVCMVDPALNICRFGSPVTDSEGRHLQCAKKGDCPPGSKCVTFSGKGVKIQKCCLDKSKCKNKPGVCPPWTGVSSCTNNSCQNDGDCPSISKCCNTTCPGLKCVEPYPWYLHF